MSQSPSSTSQKTKSTLAKVSKKNLKNGTIQILLEKLKELELMIKLSGELSEKEKLKLKSELSLLVTKSNLES